MPRRARMDAPVSLHHVIVRDIKKRKIVDDDQDRDNLFSLPKNPFGLTRRLTLAILN